MEIPQIRIGGNIINKNIKKALLVGVAAVAGYVVEHVANFTLDPMTTTLLTIGAYAIIDAIKHYNTEA